MKGDGRERNLQKLLIADHNSDPGSEWDLLTDSRVLTCRLTPACERTFLLQCLCFFSLVRPCAAAVRPNLSISICTHCMYSTYCLHIKTYEDFWMILMSSGRGLVWLKPRNYLDRFQKRSNFSYLHHILFLSTYVAWVRYWTHLT